MIERLHHLAFVERHPVSGRTGEAVTADGIRAFLFLKLLPAWRNRPESLVIWNMVEYFTGHAFTSPPDDRSTSTVRRP